MDKIISFFNENNYNNITIFYSTASKYIHNLNDEGIAWPVKHDDILTISNGEQDANATMLPYKYDSNLLALAKKAQ